MRCEPEKVFTLELDLAGVRRVESCDTVEQSGLSSTVGADQSEYFSFVDIEADRIKCDKPAEALCYISDPEE